MSKHRDDEQHEGGCLGCQLRDAKERIAQLETENAALRAGRSVPRPRTPGRIDL